MALKHRTVVQVLAIGVLAFAASCSEHSPSAPTPPSSSAPPASCAFTVAEAPASPVAPSGGEFSVSVTTTAGCGWSAASGSPFITTTGSAAGTGPGTARFIVQANGGAARQGTVQVADRTLQVTQAASESAPAPGCSFTLSRTDIPVGPSGGDVTLDVRVESGTSCAWSATANDAFITVTSGASGTGAGTVVLSVAAHSGSSGRAGTVTVAGRIVAIVQSGTGAPCSLTVSPLTFDIDYSGRTIQFTVTQTQGENCPWIASTNAEWLLFSGGWYSQSGTGTATVQMQAHGNVGPARTGTVRVAGYAITVTQGASPPVPPCAYVVSPLAHSVPYEGAWVSIRVDVSQGVNCVWPVALHASWLTMFDFTHVGPKTLTLVVQPNSFAARQGTLTVAGQTVTVDQAAHPGNCQFRIAPDTWAAGADLSSMMAYVSPIAGQHCGYVSRPSASWLRLEPDSLQIPPVGYQPVLISVDANPGPARTGTITVGNAVLTVTQAAALPATAAAVVSFDSDAGDPVGRGVSDTITMSGGQFNLAIDPATNTVSLNRALPAQPSMYVRLAPPPGMPLAPGYYPVAFRMPNATGAGVDFGYDGRSCNLVTGRLLIHEAVLAPGNTIQRFHARFEQRCDNQTTALRGTLWIDAAGSTTPPPLPSFPALQFTALPMGLRRP